MVVVARCSGGGPVFCYLLRATLGCELRDLMLVVVSLMGNEHFLIDVLRRCRRRKDPEYASYHGELCTGFHDSFLWGLTLHVHCIRKIDKTTLEHARLNDSRSIKKSGEPARTENGMEFNIGTFYLVRVGGYLVRSIFVCVSKPEKEEKYRACFPNAR
jgi:hypothetical protein